MVEEAPTPADAPLVAQVSRWDALKDPLGVVTGFSQALPHLGGAHLIVAGPDVTAVADDPEGAGVLHDVTERWRALPPLERSRIHLASLPMDDPQENAAIVNALQRRADIIVQKSRAEGFGLTVAEGMWKARAVLASRVGGIQDQIIDGVNRVLLDNPDDLDGLRAQAVTPPVRRHATGPARRRRARARARAVPGVTPPRGLGGGLPHGGLAGDVSRLTRTTAVRMTGSPARVGGVEVDVATIAQSWWPSGSSMIWRTRQVRARLPAGEGSTISSSGARAAGPASIDSCSSQ